MEDVPRVARCLHQPVLRGRPGSTGRSRDTAVLDIPLLASVQKGTATPVEGRPHRPGHPHCVLDLCFPRVRGLGRGVLHGPLGPVLPGAPGSEHGRHAAHDAGPGAHRVHGLPHAHAVLGLELPAGPRALRRREKPLRRGPRAARQVQAPHARGLGGGRGEEQEAPTEFQLLRPADVRVLREFVKGLARVHDRRKQWRTMPSLGESMCCHAMEALLEEDTLMALRVEAFVFALRSVGAA
mmetsp:Transcript_45526/g.126883  ORF Transcript_45526/g.126883 Transcript_45526/m.126883 type:complete len:239 (+) Transcript_45526:2421-3137(+)